MDIAERTSLTLALSLSLSPCLPVSLSFCRVYRLRAAISAGFETALASFDEDDTTQ